MKRREEPGKGASADVLTSWCWCDPLIHIYNMRWTPGSTLGLGGGLPGRDIRGNRFLVLRPRLLQPLFTPVTAILFCLPCAVLAPTNDLAAHKWPCEFPRQPASDPETWDSHADAHTNAYPDTNAELHSQVMMTVVTSSVVVQASPMLRCFVFFVPGEAVKGPLEIPESAVLLLMFACGRR